MKIYIVVLLFAVASVITGCRDRELSLDKIDSFNWNDVSDLIKDTNYLMYTGDLFFDNKEVYIYFFNVKMGSHYIFQYSEDQKRYTKRFEFMGGLGSREAEFVDCNFDSIKDLLINIEAGGNYDTEINIIFLKTGGDFIEVEQRLSYPVFDYRDDILLSRYQSPNDSTITIEKYKWEGNKLKLFAKNKVNDLDYIENYGNLIAN